MEIANKQSPVKGDSIQNIVYLDQNFKTFQYFLTGKFETKKEDDDYAYHSKPRYSENGPDNSFLKQLSTLNEKIKLFTSVFYDKRPRRISYQRLKDNSITV